MLFLNCVLMLCFVLFEFFFAHKEVCLLEEGNSFTHALFVNYFLSLCNIVHVFPQGLFSYF